MRIHKERRAARWTKLVHALLLSEKVTLHVILAAVEDDVGALGVDVQIAVFAAYGAVAVHHWLGLEGRGGDFVLDGAAVAVGFVPDFGGGFGVGHGKLVEDLLGGRIM